MEFLKIKYAKKLPEYSELFSELDSGTTHLVLPYEFGEGQRVCCSLVVVQQLESYEFGKYVKITPLKSMKEITCPKCKEIVSRFKALPE